MQVFDFEIGAGGEAKLSFVSPTTDPYYVMVGNIDPPRRRIEAGLGSYELTANTLSLDDHADLKADGTALAVGVTKAGAFDQPHDFDYFKIDLFAGQRYLFRDEGAGADPLGDDGDAAGLQWRTGRFRRARCLGQVADPYVPVSSATYHPLASNDRFTDRLHRRHRHLPGLGDRPGAGRLRRPAAAVALLLPGQPRTGVRSDVTDDLDVHFRARHARAGQRYVIDMTWLGNNTDGGTELQRKNDPAGTAIYDPRHRRAFIADRVPGRAGRVLLLRASNTDVSDTGLSAAIGQYRDGRHADPQDDGPGLRGPGAAADGRRNAGRHLRPAP